MTGIQPGDRVAYNRNGKFLVDEVAYLLASGNNARMRASHHIVAVDSLMTAETLLSLAEEIMGMSEKDEDVDTYVIITSDETWAPYGVGDKARVVADKGCGILEVEDDSGTRYRLVKDWYEWEVPF